MAYNDYFIKLPWEFRYSVRETSCPKIYANEQLSVPVKQKKSLASASLSEIISLDVSHQIDAIWELILGSRGFFPIKDSKEFVGLISSDPEKVNWSDDHKDGIYFCVYTDNSNPDQKQVLRKVVSLTWKKRNPPASGKFPEIEIYNFDEENAGFENIDPNGDAASKKLTDDQKSKLVEFVKENRSNDQQFRLGYLDLCLVIPVLDAFFCLVIRAFDWSSDTLFKGKNAYQNKDNRYLEAVTNFSLKTLALFSFVLTFSPWWFANHIGIPCTVVVRYALSTILTPFVFAAIQCGRGVVTACRAASAKVGSIFSPSNHSAEAQSAETQNRQGVKSPTGSNTN